MAVRKEEQTEVPVSSLIDVVFLLIMFFVITSNIEKEAFDVQIELVKAKNMKPAKQIPPKRITINVQKDGPEGKEGVIYVESVPVPKEGLKGALIGFKNRVGTAGVVMIRADKDVLFTHESDVIEAIKASGLSNIRIQAELEGGN